MTDWEESERRVRLAVAVAVGEDREILECVREELNRR